MKQLRDLKDRTIHDVQPGSRVVPSKLLFFFTLVAGARSLLSFKLSDTRVYAPQIRARLGTLEIDLTPVNIKLFKSQSTLKSVSTTRDSLANEGLGSGSEAGSYLRLINFVYHSTLGLRVIK